MRHAWFILVLLPSVLACNAVPDSLGGGRPDAPSRLTAVIDGEPFMADSNFVDAGRFGASWVLRGGRRASDSRLLSFTFDSARIGSTRPMQRGGSAYSDTRAPGIFFLDSVRGGEVRVTQFDPFNRRIIGTFHYTTRFYRSDSTGSLRATDSLAEIRDGAFDLVYIEQAFLP